MHYVHRSLSHHFYSSLIVDPHSKHEQHPEVHKFIIIVVPFRTQVLFKIWEHMIVTRDKVRGIRSVCITRTRLFKYIENFTTKKGKFSDKKKKSDIFHIPAQNIDCGHPLEPTRRGGSNEYRQSMFLSRNKKNNVYPCEPQFFLYKSGFSGAQNYIGVFSWWVTFRTHIPSQPLLQLGWCDLESPFHVETPLPTSSE